MSATGETLRHQKKMLEMIFVSSSKRMADAMSYYDKHSDLEGCDKQ